MLCTRLRLQELEGDSSSWILELYGGRAHAEANIISVSSEPVHSVAMACESLSIEQFAWHTADVMKFTLR